MSGKRNTKIWILLLVASLSFVLVGTLLTVFVGGTTWTVVGSATIGVATSVLATLITVYFIESDPEPVNTSGILRAGRNREMGDDYWIGLIRELHETPTAAVFIGSSLSRWRDLLDYAHPLAEKLRMRAARADDESVPGAYTTVFVLREPHERDQWIAWCRSALSATFPNTSDPLRRGRVCVYLSGKHVVPYSLVSCGKRLSVTPYIDDNLTVANSPTLDIDPESNLGQVYVNAARQFVLACERSDAATVSGTANTRASASDAS